MHTAGASSAQLKVANLSAVTHGAFKNNCATFEDKEMRNRSGAQCRHLWNKH